MIDGHFFWRLRNMRIVESISAVPTSVKSGLVQIDEYLNDILNLVHKVGHLGMAESCMSSITVDDSLMTTILRGLLCDQIGCHVWVHHLRSSVESLKAPVLLVPTLNVKYYSHFALKHLVQRETSPKLRAVETSVDRSEWYDGVPNFWSNYPSLRSSREPNNGRSGTRVYANLRKTFRKLNPSRRRIERILKTKSEWRNDR